MTFTEEFESIREAIYHKPWEDRGRIEACLSYALEALQRVACNEREGQMPHWIAQQALRRMEMRVRLGDDMPAGSSVEIPWDPPEPRWRETLDDEDLT